VTHSETGPVIEFAGVPGAGKSTLARRLGKQLRSAGLPVTEPTYRLAHGVTNTRRYLAKTRYAVCASATDPRRTASHARVVASTAQPTRRALVKTTFNWLFVHGVLTARHADDWTILDQGLSQAAWSVALSATRDRIPILCEAAVDSLARTERALVVVVDIAPETARERLDARSTDDTRVSATGGGHTLETAFDITARLERSLTETAARYPSVDVVCIENESPADLDSGVSTICAALGVDSA
jgi:thymidylate kinase